MKAIIFLDIDGVLTSVRAGIPFDFPGVADTFDPIAVKFLDNLCRDWPVQVVISSTWRMLHEKDFFVQRFISMGAHHLASAIHERWATPRTRDAFRGREIKLWCDETGEEIVPIIIDDGSDFLPEQLDFLIHTTWENGLLSEHFDQITAILDNRRAHLK